MWKADPTPRYIPQLTPGTHNELAECEALAQLMGLTLMPWQRRVIEVATQYREGEDGARHYVYRDVLITVPRQSGKTTLISVVGILRALRNPRAEIFLSAQTGQYAGEFMLKLINNHASVWHPTLRAAFIPTRSNGSEGFRCTNQARFTRFTRGEQALHSKTPILVLNDEIWVMDDEDGTQLVGAVRPAQATLGARAQCWYLSTMGTAKSTFMNGLVETGRAGSDPSLCYVEYAISPDGDPTDPKAWEQFHPALGNTITLETMLGDFQSTYPKTPGEWERAYCNRLTITADSAVFPRWDELPTTGAINPDTIAFGVEHSARTYAAAIVGAWRDNAGEPHVKIVRQGPRLEWLGPTLTQLSATYPGAPICIDKAGASRRIIDLLADTEGVELTPLDIHARQLADATLIEAARDLENLHHEHHRAMKDAASGLVLKTMNGATRIDRDKSETDPMLLIAAASALYGTTHPAPTPPRPTVFT